MIIEKKDGRDVIDIPAGKYTTTKFAADAA